MLQRYFLMLVLLFLPMWGVPAVLAQDPAPQEEQKVQKEQGTEIPPAQDPGQIVRPSETASTPSTGRKILTNFWADQKAMWSSPFHTKPEDTKWWGIFGAGTAALIATDRRTSAALPNTASQ